MAIELTCAEARDLASDLLDGELDAAQAAVLAAHVAGCATCPGLYRALVLVVSALRGAASDAGGGAGSRSGLRVSPRRW